MMYDTVGSMGHSGPEYKKETPQRATNDETRSKKNGAPNPEVRKPFIPESLPDEQPDKTGKVHSFSRTLSTAIQKKKGKKAHHGAHEAIVLKYLASWSAGS